MVSEISFNNIIKKMLLLIVFFMPIFMLCTQTDAQIWNMGTQTYWLDYSNLVSEANPQPSPYPRPFFGLVGEANPQPSPYPATYFMNLAGEANPQPSPYPRPFFGFVGEANPQPSPYPTTIVNNGRSNTLTNSFQTQMVSTRDIYTSGR